MYVVVVVRHENEKSLKQREELCRASSHPKGGLYEYIIW